MRQLCFDWLYHLNAETASLPVLPAYGSLAGMILINGQLCL
jgi:hypothetical protein